MRSLQEQWKYDQLVAFCANQLASDQDGIDVPIIAKAGRTIEKAAGRIAGLSESTLCLIKAIPETDIRKPPYPDAIAYDTHATIKRADQDLRELRGDQGSINYSVLATNALMLLQQDHVRIEDFFEWLSRASGRSSRAQSNWCNWTTIHKRIVSSSQLPALNALLQNSRDQERWTDQRVDSLAELFERVNTICGFDEELNPVPTAWVRLALGMVSSQFCWPLMVAGTESVVTGVSLPIGAFLSNDGKSRVWFKCGSRQFVLPPPHGGGHADVTFGFDNGNLRWDFGWKDAFDRGLATAKKLWKSQNARLMDEEEKEKKLASSLVIDLKYACETVDALFESGGKDALFKLRGRSAEAYICQVVLGLLLPQKAKPVGVATGRIFEQGGYFAIGDVRGIEKKLRFADSAGIFSRIVLPDTDLAKREVAALIDSLLEKKKIEVNHCPSARSAADAMQPSGWRRTHFLRAPAVQRTFYRMLYRLFAAQDTIDAKELLSPEDLPHPGKREQAPLSKDEVRRLEQLTKLLTSADSSVKFVPRAALTEQNLGEWLAWIDHRVRLGGGGIRGPGLGVLCLRTTDRDNEMRLWSNVFDLLNANPAEWDKFQWAGLEQAAGLLAQVLNNFHADPTISYSPPPDVIVIIDDSGFTRARTNKVFVDDFRGQLFDMLNARGARRPSFLNDKLAPLDISRTSIIGNTRIIVVYPSKTDLETDTFDLHANEDDEGTEVYDAADTLIARLAIFRFSFSVQSAIAILNHDTDSPIDWTLVQKMLDKWVQQGKLFRHRGQYHLKRTLARKLRESAFCHNAKAHLSAARSFAPIIQPKSLFLASNRDRAMEPEQFAEAVWHLQKAREYSEPRQRDIWPQILNSLGTMIFLRPSPDWDTVKELLRTGTETAQQAYELSKKLLRTETEQRGAKPHSSRFALALNAIGRFGRGQASADMRLALILEARDMFQEVKGTVEVASRDGQYQQKAKLLSEYAFCLRALRIQETEYVADLRQVEGQLDQIVLPMLGRAYLDGTDAPLSRDWFRARWQDQATPITERSKFARIACNFYGSSWDQPWIELIAMMAPDDFAADQIAGVLASWNDEYDASEFGKRIRGQMTNDRVSPALLAAAGNLYKFLTHPSEPLDPRKGPARDIALRLLQELVLSESQLCYEFTAKIQVFDLVSAMEYSPSDLKSATVQVKAVALAGAHILRDGLGASAILSRWTPARVDVDRFAKFATNFTKEWPLLSIPAGQSLTEEAYKARQQTVWNVYRWLAISDGNEWALKDKLRQPFLHWVRRLAQPNDWLFLTAYQRPDKDDLPALWLLLMDLSDEAIKKTRKVKKLQAVVTSAKRSLRSWRRLAETKSVRAELDRVDSLLQTATGNRSVSTANANLAA